MIEVSSSPAIVQNTQNIQPTTLQQEDPPKPRTQSLYLWIIVAAFLVVVGAMLFYILSGGHNSSTNSPTPTSTSYGVSPTPKVTDLAPSIATNLKTIVVIQNSDSSLEKVIVPTTQVATYIKSLPEGERFVSQSPDK